jgi:signal transduction histidine kinase
MHSLLEDHVDEGGREFLKVAESSTKLMLSLVNDLLDFSQIIAGKFRLNLDPFDFSKTLENIESIMGCLAEKKGLRINVSYADNAPLMVNSDEQRIMQVILNLMSNAIKFTTEGSVSVSVEPFYPEVERIESEMLSLRGEVSGEASRRGDISRRANPGNNNELLIKVWDTGIGISPENRSKLF